MTSTKGQKALVRELSSLRGVSYQAALNELRGLPRDADWAKYNDRVRANQGSGISTEKVAQAMEKVLPSYPEHEKLKAVHDECTAIGTFLDWLSGTKQLEIASRHQHTDSCYEDRHGDGTRSLGCGYCNRELAPVHVPLAKLIAEFFEIDERKLEAEKQAMIARLREEVP